jgi:DNA-binding GntR family transcriptional regulator
MNDVPGQGPGRESGAPRLGDADRRALERIRGAIASGEFPPGHRVTRRVVAERANVSETTAGFAMLLALAAGDLAQEHPWAPYFVPHRGPDDSPGAPEADPVEGVPWRTTDATPRGAEGGHASKRRPPAAPPGPGERRALRFTRRAIEHGALRPGDRVTAAFVAEGAGVNRYTAELAILRLVASGELDDNGRGTSPTVPRRRGRGEERTD